jgi:hypothetical protein
MRYRIFLQIPNGSAFERTETGSRSLAESVFKAFLEREELNGKEGSVGLEYQRTSSAVHRFDAALGTPDNWQGRAEEIAWLEGPGHIGRPSELEGGTRHNVHLDTATVARARKLGKNNIS